MKLSEIEFTDTGIARERGEALEWLMRNGSGWPLSWREEEKRHATNDYDPEFPPAIVGFEALAKDGVVERVGTYWRDGEERVHFRLKAKEEA